MRRRYDLAGRRAGEARRGARERRAMCSRGCAVLFARRVPPDGRDGWDPGNTTSAQIPGFTDRPVASTASASVACFFGPTPLAVSSCRIFTRHVYVERDAVRVRVCNEDYLFCARLWQNGYTVVLHAGVRCGHYDRHSGTTQPLHGKTRRQPRHHDGRVAGWRTTVGAAGASASCRERQETVEISYVWPEG